ARIYIGFIAMSSNYYNDTDSVFDVMRALGCVQSFHLIGICSEDVDPVDWHTPKKYPSCLRHHIKGIKIFALKRKDVEFQL
ncbi:hypothetical protein J1N35_044768, partial [Gossypium stocksii]